MAGHLSTELLKAHNVAHLKEYTKKKRNHLAVLDKRSDAGSMVSFSTQRERLTRLRGKLRHVGMAFSKARSEVHNTSLAENTYKLEPEGDNGFSPCNVRAVINHILKSNLEGKDYNPSEVPQLCKTLADLIKEKVKSCGVQRYKLVCYVLIMENKGQSIRHASRCLWDTSLDSFATGSYDDKTFCVVGSVYATYFA